MNTDSYSDWVSIYNDNIKNVWQNQRFEMKKLSMIYLALTEELTKVSQQVQVKINILENKFQKLDSLSKNIEKLENNYDEPQQNVIPETEYVKSPSQSSGSNNFNNTVDVLSVKSPKIIKKKIENFLFPNRKTINLPLDSPDIIDSSIVEESPKSKFNFKENKFLNKRQKLIRTSKTLTVLQPKQNPFLEQLNKETPESMDIDEMIQYINRDSKENIPIPVKQITQKKKEIIEKNSEIKRDNNNDSLYFDKKVRGKARKNLPGWSCKECEGFYKILNLPHDELKKKMNECSRHRSHFERPETPAGYWNLSIISDSSDSEDSQKSRIFKI